MRIAVIGSKGLPPQQGGIEHHCAEIYPRLVAQGHSVDLYARSSYSETYWNKSYDYKGVRVINVPCLKKKGIDAFLTSLISTLMCLPQRYDVIHFHALGPAIFAWLPKLKPGVKVVVTCHGLDWQRSKWNGFARRLIHAGERVAVRCADEFVVVAENLQPYFSNTYRRNTTYIGNGPAGYAESDPDFAFGRSLGLEKNRYFVFLGRLVPEKCVDLLLRAYKSLADRGWKLAIVGGCSDTTTYVQQLNALAEDRKDIVFTGFLEGQHLAEVVSNAGVFVLPSAVEGLPLALLEAMAAKLPIIASDIPVHQQILNDRRGLLFSEGRQASLEEKLQWAIEHPEKMQEMGQRASEYVAVHYNWDKISEQLLALYEKDMATGCQVVGPVAKDSLTAG